MLSLFLPVVTGCWLDGGDLCTFLTPTVRKGSGRDRGQGEPGFWGHRDTAFSCHHPRDPRLTAGTEPGGAGTAPASPVAAEGFDGRGFVWTFSFKDKGAGKMLYFQSLLPPVEAIFPPVFFPLSSIRGL